MKSFKLILRDIKLLLLILKLRKSKDGNRGKMKKMKNKVCSLLCHFLEKILKFLKVKVYKNC